MDGNAITVNTQNTKLRQVKLNTSLERRLPDDWLQMKHNCKVFGLCQHIVNHIVSWGDKDDKMIRAV